MKKQTFGAALAALRKERGMTQLELAEKMGVTDKAVSKWERDLSLPDVNTIPKLAELFGLTVDELMQGEGKPRSSGGRGRKASQIACLACKGIAAGAGIEVVVLSLLGLLDTVSAIRMLGIGLACLAISQLPTEGP